MNKELFEKGFEVETKIKGVAVAIRPYNENSAKKGAQLQFATITNKGLQTIDVKIEASREEDLQKFINQFVVINNVNVSKVDFNTYYSCPDISLVKIENIKGA
jgi:hypothetical protein